MKHVTQKELQMLNYFGKSLLRTHGVRFGRDYVTQEVGLSHGDTEIVVTESANDPRRLEHGLYLNVSS